jgi:hypothetical protein
MKVLASWLETVRTCNTQPEPDGSVARLQTYLVHSSPGAGYIIFGRYTTFSLREGPYHIVRPLIIPVDILPCDHTLDQHQKRGY